MIRLVSMLLLFLFTSSVYFVYCVLFLNTCSCRRSCVRGKRSVVFTHGRIGFIFFFSSVLHHPEATSSILRVLKDLKGESLNLGRWVGG